ncbi:hypothetical protein ACFOW4_11675 [Micromonospora sp. GCM10011542]|uniref:hypothetical protein n=1 Tax=Micromonospora sp. GCM10011542 TaxID=3317337 RepID=UPI00361E66DC
MLLEFYWSVNGTAKYRTTDRRLACLGMWLTDDIQSVHDSCLDLLADLEDIAAGRKVSESWEGNAWAAELSAEGVDLQCLWRDVLSAHYPLGETRRVVAQYWRLLAAKPGRDPAITRWEERNCRPHPRPSF